MHVAIHVYLITFPAATGTTSALIVAEVGHEQRSRVGLRTSQDWPNTVRPLTAQHCPGKNSVGTLVQAENISGMQ